MHEIDLNRLDLNLLKVFIAIFEESNVTAAGARLGLAQSSMSHALTRLRTALQDPLFVRCNNGMIPTSYAEVIAEPIQQCLDNLGSALDRGRAFDPLESGRTFNIVMTDLGEAAFLPPLMHHLNKHAPTVTVSVIQTRPEMYHQALSTGQADLVIGLLPSGRVDLFQQRLFDADLACFVRAGHPLQHDLTLESFLQASHIVMAPSITSEQHVQRALGPLALQRRIALRLQHYMVVPRVLLGTDLISILPMGVGDYSLLQGRLVHLPCPFRVEPLVLRQMWHAKSQHDGGCRWLRQQLSFLFRNRRADLEPVG